MSEKIVHLTKENFKQEVEDYKGEVLMDFWAEWCMPCQMMAPVFEELAAERGDIKFAKIDVDKEPELAIRFRVNSIPAFILMKDGKAAAATVGFMEKDKLEKFVEENR